MINERGTLCWEMFAVEYFHEFHELYTTREDMGVVASKCHESIMASLYHYFKQDSAVPSPHGSLSSSVPSSAIDSWLTTVIEELIIATE